MCPLPHWEGCDGDIPKGEETKGKAWAPCPEGSLTTTDDEEKDAVDSDEEVMVSGKASSTFFISKDR